MQFILSEDSMQKLAATLAQEVARLLGATMGAPAPETAMDVIGAADYLRVSERTVRKLVADSSLRHRRVGRRIIFMRSDLDRYLDRKALRKEAY